MTHAFPEDLLVQIRLRLPAKSLIRFKCCCKSWYALISNPSFISKNLLFSFNNNKNAYLLAKRRDNITNDHVFSLLSYDTLELSVTRDLACTEINKERDVYVVGSPCNGIVCLCNTGFNVVLWNPATSETMVLPESGMPGHANPQIGFGFDVKTKDYKVIKIRYMWDLSKHQVEVYSLSNDSWRELDDNVPASLIPSFGDHTYAKGIFSWWAVGYFGAEYGDGLVSFDISNEVFKTTPLPDASIIGGYGDNLRTFFSFNDSVSLVLKNYHEQSFEIWVLLEYGVKESWTKLFNIKPLPGIELPLGFGKNGELFLETTDGKLVLCDPTTQEISNLQSKIVGVPKSFQLVTLVETTAPIKGGN